MNNEKEHGACRQDHPGGDRGSGWDFIFYRPYQRGFRNSTWNNCSDFFSNQPYRLLPAVFTLRDFNAKKN